MISNQMIIDAKNGDYSAVEKIVSECQKEVCYEKHSKYKNIFNILLKNVFLCCSMQFKLHLLQMGVTRTLYPI